MGIWGKEDPNQIDVFDAPMGNPGWILLGLCLPPVAAFVYIFKKHKKPSQAKAIMVGILLFFIAALIFVIVDALNGYPVIGESMRMKAENQGLVNETAAQAAKSVILY